jgi:hypothetical protein
MFYQAEQPHEGCATETRPYTRQKNENPKSRGKSERFFIAKNIWLRIRLRGWGGIHMESFEQKMDGQTSFAVDPKDSILPKRGSHRAKWPIIKKKR